MLKWLTCSSNSNRFASRSRLSGGLARFQVHQIDCAGPPSQMSTEDMFVLKIDKHNWTALVDGSERSLMGLIVDEASAGSKEEAFCLPTPVSPHSNRISLSNHHPTTNHTTSTFTLINTYRSQSNTMEPWPVEPSCLILEKLPVELRLEIYAYLLTFAAPLKLRQVIPGSRDLAILRTNRQIHDEALGVLYELNTIVVTRNGRSTLDSPHPFHRIVPHRINKSL